MSVDAASLMLAFGKSLLFVLASLLPILNPAGTAPIFLGLTEGASRHTRAVLAKSIARNAALLTVGAMLVGSYVLDLFGISLPVVRVAGGSIIAANAWRMLSTGQSASKSHQALMAKFTPEMARARAFYPLTFPITCGPGSIAAAITIGVTLHDADLVLSLAQFGGGAVALMAIACIIFLAFRYATALLRPLGEIGMLVFLRLSSFILLCLGVQIVWDGFAELLRSVLH